MKVNRMKRILLYLIIVVLGIASFDHPERRHKCNQAIKHNSEINYNIKASKDTNASSMS